MSMLHPTFIGLIAFLFTLLTACEAREDPSPGAPAEPPQAQAQNDAEIVAAAMPDTGETALRYSELMAFAREQNLHERPIGEVLMALGLQFRGRPYVVGPLDGFGREVLVCRLDAFDCFTFLEAMLAAARGVAVEDYSFDAYVQRTQEQRYRGGEMGDYCSRLHYYTEWIYDNEKKGLVRDVTREVGGVPFEKEYGFMSANRSEYAALAEDDDMYRCIQDVEARLNREVNLFYIPQDRIRDSYDRLQPGDLIATATHIDGLDVTHTGMVYKGEDGSTGLLHASTNGGVIISPDLQDYVQGNRVQIGIIVARAVELDEPADS